MIPRPLLLLLLAACSNTAPSVTLTLPSPAETMNADDDITFSANVADFEDAPPELTVTWTSDRDGEFFEGAPDEGGVSTFTQRGFSLGVHTITVRVRDAEDAEATDTGSFRINAAPGAPTLTLLPDAPGTDDALTVRIDNDASDADGDVVTYVYRWRVDGEDSPSHTTETLPATATSRGQTWTVEVNAFDGLANGPTIVASAAIGNTPPVLANVTLTPSEPTEWSTLTCGLGALADADGDAIGVTYHWFVNGTALSLDTSTIEGTHFDRGDVVACAVTPGDGRDAGAMKISPGVTVQNSPPTLIEALLAPVEPSRASMLTCTPGDAFDADGDSITYAYAWKVDDVARPETTPTLAASSVDVGAEVKCTITPEDDEDSGFSVTSDTVTITNAAPTIGLVTLTPETVFTTSTVAAEGAITDPDGDPLTVTYTWYVDGSPRLAGPSSTFFGTENLPRGADVFAVIEASDGVATHSRASNTITVANSVPTAPEVALTPTSPSGSEPLVCAITIASTDADSEDTLAYTFTWKVDGVMYTGLTATTTYTGDTLESAYQEPSDQWTCEAIATDGTATSAAGVSETVSLPSAWQELAMAGGDTACAMQTNGAVYCWGSNGYPLISSGSQVSFLRPARIGETWDWSSIVPNTYHACGVTVDGALYCWGANDYGALGDGTTITRSAPERIGSASNWTMVAPGDRHTCALNDAGEIYCWGLNSDGQLGDGTTTNQHAPMRVGTASDWTYVSGAGAHVCALNSAQELHCWGLGTSGQLGNGGTTSRVMPTRVGAASDWVSVAAGRAVTCATNTQDELYCWGANFDNQLGDGTTNDRATPTRIGAERGWASVSPARYHTCAVSTVGELFCWGYNSHGQVGDGTTSKRSLPVQVGAEKHWSNVATGANHSCAITDAGKIWCWGYNANGQVGDLTLHTRLAPVPIADP